MFPKSQLQSAGGCNIFPCRASLHLCLSRTSVMSSRCWVWKYKVDLEVRKLSERFSSFHCRFVQICVVRGFRQVNKKVAENLHHRRHAQPPRHQKRFQSSYTGHTRAKCTQVIIERGCKIIWRIEIELTLSKQSNKFLSWDPGWFYLDRSTSQLEVYKYYVLPIKRRIPIFNDQEACRLSCQQSGMILQTERRELSIAM